MNLLNWLTMPGPLWADMNKFRNMGSQFRGPRAQVESDEIFTGAVLLLVLVVVIYILWRIAARHERHGAYNSPRRLFQQLCKAHALDRKGRQLLKRMARHYRLTQPAQLFLEPARFEPAQLGPQFAAELAAVSQLRQTLFADAESLGRTGEVATSRQCASNATNSVPVHAETSPAASDHQAVQHA